MEIFVKAIPYRYICISENTRLIQFLINIVFTHIRLMFGIVYAGLVWVTPRFQNEDGQFPFYYYAIVIVIYAVHQVFTKNLRFLIYLNNVVHSR